MNTIVIGQAARPYDVAVTVNPFGVVAVRTMPCLSLVRDKDAFNTTAAPELFVPYTAG